MRDCSLFSFYGLQETDRDLGFPINRQIIPRIPILARAGIFTRAPVDNKFNYASLSFKAVQSLPCTKADELEQGKTAACELVVAQLTLRRLPGW